MADCFLVLPPLTRDKAVILGKNSQRPATEVQEVIYKTAKINSDGAKVQCTYIEVDQVKKTNAVIISKPAWMWGAEMGSNDQGVSVAMAPIWTKVNGPSDLEERLLGQDLTRLALERANTARDAVVVITKLLSQYGQGGAGCEETGSQKWGHHNSFLIADKEEGWILETARNYWVAKVIKDGFYNISTTPTIGCDFDMSSEDLVERCIKEGLYITDSGPFNFAAIFSDPQRDEGGTADRRDKGRQLLEKFTAKKEFGLVEMMEILRDQESNICMSGPFMTTGSMISVISPIVPACHWLTATPNPVASFFKPFIFCPNNQAGTLTSSPFYGEKNTVKLTPQEQVDRSHPLVEGHKKLLDLLEQDELQGHMIKKNLRELEQNCLEDIKEVLSQFTEQSCVKVAAIFSHMCNIEMNFYKM
ncbi:secernin-2-like [Saccostrea echinata]|uniref:secernin-2-like n=1 Tax=Saccostrea echinata TaxID=191078 RepID=UPI002A8295D5|nr:secernin-2-like [Saccostrea echinata]